MSEGPEGRSEATRELPEPSEEMLADLEEAMRDVVDPELGINVVDLGLVYGIGVEKGDTGTVALIDMAPGCDLRRDTCAAKFGNLLNFGGFPDIPGRNPFGGTSIV